MKKCCLNCAFCLKKKEKLIFNSRGLVNDVSSKIFTDEERQKAFLGDFNFVGSEIKARNDWEKQYYQIIDSMKKGVYNGQLGGPQVLELLQHSSRGMASQKIIELFGLPQPPESPDADYLSCWHNLWDFKDKKDEFSALNQKNDCLFFYPYNKKGNKSFEGCEKERKALLSKSRYMTTNTLVILGILVTIIIFAIQKWDSRQNSSSKEIITPQETIAVISPDKSTQPGERNKQ